MGGRLLTHLPSRAPRSPARLSTRLLASTPAPPPACYHPHSPAWSLSPLKEAHCIDVRCRPFFDDEAEVMRAIES